MSETVSKPRYKVGLWKVKKIDNLIMPLQALYTTKVSAMKWLLPSNPPVETENGVTIDFSSGKIDGILIGDNIQITDFTFEGESASVYMMDTFFPALEQSTGLLEAASIWGYEERESDLLFVENGVVRNEKANGI